MWQTNKCYICTTGRNNHCMTERAHVLRHPCYIHLMEHLMENVSDNIWLICCKIWSMFWKLKTRLWHSTIIWTWLIFRRRRQRSKFFPALICLFTPNSTDASQQAKCSKTGPLSCSPFSERVQIKLKCTFIQIHNLCPCFESAFE